MRNKIEETTIAAIRSHLDALGWTTVIENIEANPYKPGNDCHLELYHEDGTRKGWGLFTRLYCWTEAYEGITGKSWLDIVVKPN